ncbi:MAG: hypothetical protein ACREJB_14410 [Planctomycetaceae bacterium]
MPFDYSDYPGPGDEMELSPSLPYGTQNGDPDGEYGEYGEYCPTPEQIAEQCREIRAGWSEREFWKRAGYRDGRPHWQPPEAALDEVLFRVALETH